ncbi:MAG: DUF1501 domain-containing protein [Planctomycetota bacterium]|nr:DUF1501 domain-containing protein [Planctomycetota bacterium]
MTPSRRGWLKSAPAIVTAWWAGKSRSAESGSKGTGAKRVICIFNAGAPSHIDLFDPKPDAPEDIRGIFKPISTAVPGMRFTELLPRMAVRAKHLSLIRTLHHKHSSHNSGMTWTITGRPYRMDSTLVNPGPTDNPSLGTLVGWLAAREGATAVPPYVITPHPHCDSFAYLSPGQFGGCLGRRFDPLVVGDDPSRPGFRLRALEPAEGLNTARLAERSQLLSRLGSHEPAQTALRERAMGLVSSPALRDAFHLDQEPERVRERYGKHPWGQSHLLARRLIEAGCRFVTTVNGPSITWDTHKDNFNSLKNRLVPPMEQAFAALIDDLADRGMLEDTIVLWLGDFGRTPVINKDTGRDHWPYCYTGVLAGGGLRSGAIIGTSDRTGAAPRDFPVTPGDLNATVLSALGYDPHGIFFTTADGRPALLAEGTPIRSLLG